MIKFNRYQRAGVKEYWIVDPVYETVDVYLLANGVYLHRGIFGNDDKVSVTIFKEFEVDLTSIFPNE